MTYSHYFCGIFSRLEDAVSLVSLFNIIHPHSESALEAARQQATGTDLLKVRTPTLTKRIPAEVIHKFQLYQSEMVQVLKKKKASWG